MRKVAVVIPNLNGMAYLEACLGSLEVQKYPVIMVDNGSTDGSVEFVKKYYPEVELICLDKNYGFCKAVNEGIKSCDAEFVILLNNDTKAAVGFVENLLNAIQQDEKIFSCQAKMMQMDKPDLIDSAGDFYCALGWQRARGKDCLGTSCSKADEIFSSCGGAAIYRRDVFEKIGYFDEAHFAYLEDVDIGYRARIAGYQNRFVPDATVYHKGSGATGSRYNRFKVEHSAKNNVYMIYKNMPYWQIVINLPFLVIGWLIKFLFFSVKGMGPVYIKGLWKGVLLARAGEKVSFLPENLDNCWSIQLQLWKNLFLLLRKNQ
ncbi:MAG: glycosyltransferase family 2 protein [Eubacteriales bacterium]|nr:glycosyltransferase family 2 protein [Eubacteriales bacterium]